MLLCHKSGLALLFGGVIEIIGVFGLQLRASSFLQVFRYSTTLEKHKLFISGLPFSCTKEELEDVCKAHGNVKDIRLVTNRAGKPKVGFLNALLM